MHAELQEILYISIHCWYLNFYRSRVVCHYAQDEDCAQVMSHSRQYSLQSNRQLLPMCAGRGGAKAEDRTVMRHTQMMKPSASRTLRMTACLQPLPERHQLMTYPAVRQSCQYCCRACSSVQIEQQPDMLLVTATSHHVPSAQQLNWFGQSDFAVRKYVPAL